MRRPTNIILNAAIPRAIGKGGISSPGGAGGAGGKAGDHLSCPVHAGMPLHSALDMAKSGWWQTSPERKKGTESAAVPERPDSLRLPKCEVDAVVLVPKRVRPPTHHFRFGNVRPPTLAAPALTEAHGLASLSLP